MSITLEGVVLPPGLVWQDLDHTSIKQSVTESVTGKVVIQRGSMQDGRPINLTGGSNAWLKRADADVISALRLKLDPLTLDYHGTTYKVRFMLSDTSHFVVRGVYEDLSMNEADTMCTLQTLKLIEVDE